ncbi:MAG: dTDP-4-dehydrorhamnose 3,5-epimerase family protein [Candidatus Lindowbacteria bacterium]|nr:dTDP-4-dehydrorhamnose 3,5-epimerase family protein [Candidatus Lindowbacteria bacterium]
MIEGVKVKDLVTHSDERGYFREIIRETDEFFSEGFGQWSVSQMHQGTVKAWHVHKKQTDWWYVGRGAVKTVLHDLRDGSPTKGKTDEWLMGDNYKSIVLKIPPGVAHGCKCIAGPSDLIYITSNIYNPEDEGRIAHDNSSIGYDWLKGPEIT